MFSLAYLLRITYQQAQSLQKQKGNKDTKEKKMQKIKCLGLKYQRKEMHTNPDRKSKRALRTKTPYCSSHDTSREIKHFIVLHSTKWINEFTFSLGGGGKKVHTSTNSFHSSMPFPQLNQTTKRIDKATFKFIVTTHNKTALSGQHPAFSSSRVL